MSFAKMYSLPPSTHTLIRLKQKPPTITSISEHNFSRSICLTPRCVLCQQFRKLETDIITTRYPGSPDLATYVSKKILKWGLSAYSSFRIKIGGRTFSPWLGDLIPVKSFFVPFTRSTASYFYRQSLARCCHRTVVKWEAENNFQSRREEQPRALPRAMIVFIPFSGCKRD